MKHSSKPRLIVLGALVAGLTITTAPIAVAQSYAANSPANCSSYGFITTGVSHINQQVDTITGNTQRASDQYTDIVEGTSIKLDALGYNTNDSTLYGWDHTHKKAVRVSASGYVEPINPDEQHSVNFYAGDVSNTQNRYYAYRPGQAYGLYFIELDQSHEHYGAMVHVANSEKLSLKIGDLAFHPTNGFAYAVDNHGDLHQIDTALGKSIHLGHIGISGQFGAAFFDADENLYIAQNSSGNVFKIALRSESLQASLFTHSPSSTLTDGYRCAPEQDASKNNSALINDLGKAPNSVSFITTLVQDRTAHIQVSSSENGYLSAWFDANRDGVYDKHDQVVSNQLITSGEQRVSFTMPADMSTGQSWARFRITSTPNLVNSGSATVDSTSDYSVMLLENSQTVASYPSQNEFVTVAFEDNWPFVDDYDMNDLVTQLRTHTYRNASGYTRVEISGTVTAAGSQYENGFAIRLPGVQRAAINEQDLEFMINGTDVLASPLELDRSEAIFIITENALNHMDAGPYCFFYRTEEGCGADAEFSFHLSIPFVEPQTAELAGVFDPFLFATPGAFHGGHFKTPPGRSFEVHLKNQAPTEAFDQKLFRVVGQDRSSQRQGTYFHTQNGMPWALEMGGPWSHPQESVEITAAYPQFEAWATSSGTTNREWHLPENAINEQVFSQ